MESNLLLKVKDAVAKIRILLRPRTNVTATHGFPEIDRQLEFELSRAYLESVAGHLYKYGKDSLLEELGKQPDSEFKSELLKLLEKWPSKKELTD